MMIMDKRNEIYELGKKVDLLQQLNCKTDNKQEILELIDSITVYFENNDGDNTDIDYNVVYFYTKANYLTVLIEVVKTQKIKLYESNNSLSYGTEDEMLYDFTVLRLSYLRKALQLYNLCEKSDVAEAWMLQVYVNLANLYMETGRVVESIQVLETCKFSFGMALGNYAAKIYQLSTCTLDEHEQKELLLFAKYHYHILSENSETSLVPQDILESFKKAENHVDIVLKEFFEDVPIYEDFEVKELSEFEIRENIYRTWCRENQLALSVINICQKKSLVDSIHIPNLGIGYFAKDNTLTYYSWFNTLKLEFNMARYNLYLTEINIKCGNIHESQENILLVNTLDYPSIGYCTEMLKTALKTAYSVLDKIGMFCHSFVKGETGNIRRVDFYSWYNGIEKEIALHSGFSALHWMARDLNHKDGSYKTCRLLRNVIEHRYLRVLDNYDVSLEEELKDQNKMEYQISYNDLKEQVLFVLKFIRAALFYLVFAFNFCYMNVIEECKENKKIFFPLGLDYYDDEWKN